MISASESSAFGYLHGSYARSFAQFADARPLRGCGGWVLERTIPDSELTDAMGCYPLFCCRDWSALRDDLEGLSDEFVSLSIVTDPFGDYSSALLENCFDNVIHFKQHFIADPRHVEHRLPRKHRRNLARAMQSVNVSRCSSPSDRLTEWCDLYAQLCRRHNIRGLRAFSKEAFEIQLAIPGAVMFRATANEEVVGLHLWYKQGDVAYAHLGATSEKGYSLMAAYALYWASIEYFRDRVRELDLGASAGYGSGVADGLARFKQGWSSGTRPVYFCGRVLNKAQYVKLACEQIGRSDFFPAYRNGFP